MYSQNIEDALSLSAIRHRDQVRKGGEVPYITHPVHVAMILNAHGHGEDAIIVALLHDVVEDSSALLPPASLGSISIGATGIQ